MKSQVGIEFLTGVAILLIVYTITISIYSFNFRAPVVTTEQGRQVCYMISETIDSAVLGGNGFSSNLSLPEKIGTNEYFVMVTDSSLITVDWGMGIFACSVTSQGMENIVFKPSRISVINVYDYIFVASVETNKKVYSPMEEIEISGVYYFVEVELSILDENRNFVDGGNFSTNFDGTFSVNMTLPDQTGSFIIYVSDSLYKNLNSETTIEIA